MLSPSRALRGGVLVGRISLASPPGSPSSKGKGKPTSPGVLLLCCYCGGCCFQLVVVVVVVAAVAEAANVMNAVYVVQGCRCTPVLVAPPRRRLHRYIIYNT